jgi:hypothetical protein
LTAPLTVDSARMVSISVHPTNNRVAHAPAMGRRGLPRPLSQAAVDAFFQQFRPMLEAISARLDAAGIRDRPEMLLADSRCWSSATLIQLPNAPQLLIHRPSTAAMASPAPAGWARR